MGGGRGHDWGGVDLKARIPSEVPGLTTARHTRTTPE